MFSQQPVAQATLVCNGAHLVVQQVPIMAVRKVGQCVRSMMYLIFRWKGEHLYYVSIVRCE